MRKGILVSTSVIFPLALAMPLFGCLGGREVSIGANAAQLSSVDPATVTAPSSGVPACSTGAAHPNVCCSAGPGSASKCGVYEGAPFHECDTGYKTYPDPRSCCDLADPSKCAAPPPPPPTPPPSCGYYCPPGWYTNGDACCRTDANGAGECFASTWSTGVGGTSTTPSSGGSAPPKAPPGWGSDAGAPNPSDASSPPSCDPSTGPCACGEILPLTPDGGAPNGAQADAGSGCTPLNPPPACDPSLPCGAGASEPPCLILPDGGGSCPPPPLPSCCTAPPPPSCDQACPDGWKQAQGTPDVCCQSAPDGTFSCFSQATGPVGAPPSSIDDGGISVAPTPADAGPAPTSRACGGAANGSSCGCTGTINGVDYAMNCSSTSGSCTCSVNGAMQTYAATNPCASPDASWTTLCKFPL